MDSEGKSVEASSRSSTTSITTPPSPLSMVSSSTSEGVVLDQDDVNTGIDFDSEDCSTDDDDDRDDVDGLVLMGSTRLRPAPETSMDIVSKQVLYTQTFKKLFVRSDCTASILPLALHGNLHDSPFRSLCWRVFLNVLSGNSQQWTEGLKTVRNNYKVISLICAIKIIINECISLVSE